MITAVLIDSREPDWIKNLKFNGIPCLVNALEAGDLWAVMDDGHSLRIERKTPDDFLNSLRDERLFPQLARLAQYRIAQQAAGQQVTYWTYLVITGEFRLGSNGKVVTERDTGWAWSAVWGAILTIQEMGVFVVFCAGDLDYEACIMRLADRKREGVINLLPPRVPNILGPQAAILATLPGIGLERVQDVMKWSANNVAVALCGLTDLEIDAPVGKAVRGRIRSVLGLRDAEQIHLDTNKAGDEILNKNGDDHD